MLDRMHASGICEQGKKNEPERKVKETYLDVAKDLLAVSVRADDRQCY